MSIENIAEKFFKEHPLNSEIIKFSAEQRFCAVAAAERDVAAELKSEILPDDAKQSIIDAVCEQALFLLLHPEYLSGDKSFEKSNLSPRAAVLLKSREDAAGPVSLVRG